MKQKIMRRNFLKQGLAVSGGMALLAKVPKLHAKSQQPVNANEIIKTILLNFTV